MFDLARLDQSRIDLLVSGQAALLDEQAAALFGERDDFDALDRAPTPVAAKVDVLGLYQPLVAKILQIVLGEGLNPQPEIMVPLVGGAEEMGWLRGKIDEVAARVFEDHTVSVQYLVGTMIELPRAAVCAGAIAEHVSFVSFGTNDLTQMTFGFSRDDAGSFLGSYLEQGLLKSDPFVTIDRPGVGALSQSRREEWLSTESSQS